MRKTFAKLIALPAMGLILLTGCKKENSEPETAQLMIAHKVPDGATVDVYADNSKVAGPLTYNSSTSYLKLPVTTKNIKITAAGSTAAIANFNVTLAANKMYTFFAANRSNALQSVLLEDNLITPSAGKAHIRVVHLSPDAPAVNVFNGNASTALFSNVSFKNTTAFLPVDATATGSALTLNVRSGNTTVLSQAVTVFPGKIYTVIVRGFVTPPTGNSNTLAATVITNR